MRPFEFCVLGLSELALFGAQTLRCPQANRFIWPGPDLRPARQDDLNSVAFGLLPEGLFNQIRDSFIAKVRAGKLSRVSRTE